MILCWLSWIDAHPDAVTAIATAVIAIFTIALASVSLWQACLIKKQVALGREEFRATHRPKITIRACKLTGIGVTADHKWPCKVTYQNEGASPAFIREIGTRVFQSENPWTHGDREIQFHKKSCNEVLKSGEDNFYVTSNDFDCDAIEHPWFFAGYIEYSDLPIGGTVRKVGFLRKWDGRSGLGLGDHEWRKESNEEYEYSY